MKNTIFEKFSFAIKIVSIIFSVAGFVSAASPVNWINAVNVTINGNNISRIDANVCNGCLTGATSQQQITGGNGYLEFTATSGSNGYIGLGNNTTNSTSNLEINFGIGFGGGGWTIRELNYTYRTEGTYSANDVFRVAVEGTQVKYYKNGSLLYTSTATPTYPFVIDSSLWNSGSRIDNVMIEAGQSPPQPPTLVSSRCLSYTAPLVPVPLRTFYVDGTNGNDASGGTSLATAWRTLNKANNFAIPGDLFLLRGTFTNQMINPVNSGTATNKIIYRKETGQTAVLDSTQGSTIYGVVLSGKSHVVVDGLELRNIQDGPAATVADGGHDNWFRNLYIHHGGGVFFTRNADNNRLEDSVVTEIGSAQFPRSPISNTNDCPPNSSDSCNAGDAIKLSDGADNNTIVRNYVGRSGHMGIEELIQNNTNLVTSYNIIAQNVVINSYSGGINILGGSRNALIECNKIANSGQEIYPDVNIGTRQGLIVSGKNGTYRYNLIYNSKSDGILVEGRVWATEVKMFAENNSFYQNTIVGNGRSGLFIDVRDLGNPTGTNAYVRNNTFENNILWNNVGNSPSNGTNADVVTSFYYANTQWSNGFTDGNLFRYNNISNIPVYNFTGMLGSGNFVKTTVSELQSTYLTWTNNRQQNPLFTNISTNDYSLQSSSPMIDVGRLISGVLYNGVAPDLGAIEYGNPPASQQAIVFNGINQYGVVTLPNVAPFNSLGGFQVIWRVRNVGSNNGRMFSSGFGGIIANGSTYTGFDWRDGINIYMPPTNYADSICKLQFDPANSRWTFETWKADGTGYVSRTAAITNTSDYNLGGTDVAVGANSYGTSLFIQEKLDYWGWIQRVEPLGTFSGTSLPIGVTYLLKYEFNGNGSDSSGRGLNLNLFNNPTFENTP
jgi:Right handed beta helix region